MRNGAILEALAPRFDLDIVTLVHDPRLLDDPGPLVRLGRWTPVVAWHRRGSLHRIAGQLAYRIAGSGWGREAWFQSSRSLAGTVASIVRSRRPKIVHAAYWYTLRHLNPFPPGPTWIIDTHDVQMERSRRLQGTVPPRELDHEVRELARYDWVLAITPRDAETFRSLLGPRSRIETFGMGVDLDRWSARNTPRGPDRGQAVVYYGNLRSEANRAAAIHLCREILPEIRKLRPGVEVVLLGADPGPDVTRLASIPGVRVTGTVADPRDELGRSAVFALCLRAASGIRSRACEVMALEIPVVAYPEALEGMSFEEGRDYLAARSAGEFGAQIDRLLSDPGLARRIGRAARDRVAAEYGIEATYGRLAAFYGALAG